MATRNPAHIRRNLAGLMFFALAALAFTTATSEGARNQPGIARPFLAGSNVPEPVRAVLQRACQNCHSENTVWPWYSQIPPVSWQIHDDVARGRAFMNLSKWSDYSEGQRRGFTVAIGAAIQSKLMPPAKYVWLHREARLSGDEIELVKAWTLAEAGPTLVTSQLKPAVAAKP
jgi:heme-binding protein